MTLGNKIRVARLKEGITQKELAENKITRNMLSSIESDKALPSLDTLLHIAKRLNTPIGYLLSEEEDMSFYKKQELIDSIRTLFKERRYSECIELVEEIGSLDDELTYILVYSNFELGVASAKSGAFLSAEKHLSSAIDYSSRTIYDTKIIECRVPLYMSFVKNVNFPLLDFDRELFIKDMVDAVDLEFFNYLSLNQDYEYKNPLFAKHVEAKNKIKERRYLDAIELLTEIIDEKASYEYNSYLMYCVYGDLDNCYKQIRDFENAYKYSGKRISMLEGFNS